MGRATISEWPEFSYLRSSLQDSVLVDLAGTIALIDEAFYDR